MTWLSAILGALQALPALINLGTEFVTWIKHVSGNDPQGYMNNLANAMAQLNAAKTEEDRTNAAKSIADAIRGLP